MDIEKANSYSTYLQNFNLRNQSVIGNVVAPNQTVEQPAHEVRTAEGQDNNTTQEVTKVEKGNASLADISVSFGNKDSSLLGLGASSNMQSSDMMKQAINSMQRDHVLREYQYFVGSKVKENNPPENNILTSDQDGTVIKL